MGSLDWTLFLDRDGVINERIAGGYVLNWDQFHFLPGAVDALVKLAYIAPRIIVVTNQQGVGKGLMTAFELESLHERMKDIVSAAGGRIDSVRACTHLATTACGCRKPRPGLALDYYASNPQLAGSLSVLAGDSTSDMEMARALSALTDGCSSVAIGDELRAYAADYYYKDLAAMAMDDKWRPDRGIGLG